MPSSRRDIVEVLQQRLQQLENGRLPEVERISTGIAALDRLFHARGIARGALVEWLGREGEGSGATTLAMIVARQACRTRETLVVVDSHRRFYAPAAARLGIDLERLVVVRPENHRDYHWALNQILRCEAVAAVLCWPEKLEPRAFRRLQLSAEEGKSVGLLVRPAHARAGSTWAEARLLVQSLPAAQGSPAGGSRRLRIEAVYCRGGTCGAAVELELDEESGVIHEAHPVCMASSVADSTASRRTAGA